MINMFQLIKSDESASTSIIDRRANDENVTEDDFEPPYISSPSKLSSKSSVPSDSSSLFSSCNNL
ncbi:hypothetical protein BpHYR1_008204 [Brachionus plicatilis]|uniref:Uncharacterized protein n=1 Tax=Brachionus plicatilis TaxID=10195 RepID=A0A3M7QPA6_BRAPC|nr:hypothetical protein BpHYR1_008204 [Brachionus plicatilis]